MSEYFSRYATSPGKSLVVRYACKAASSNAYESRLPEWANTTQSQLTVTCLNASLAV